MTDTRAREQQGDPTQDPEFAQRVLDSMREAFWDPEIARRGGSEVTGPIVKALAILRPGEPVEVRFNDEVELVANARMNAAIQRGEPVTVDNVDAIETLELLGVDLDAGWVAFAVLPDGQPFLQFDLVRNRGRSLRLLSLAQDYLASARNALEDNRPGPTIENSMAAAELAVTAQTYTFDTELPESGGRRNAHSARLHWTKVQVGLGNTIPTAHDTMRRLNGLRKASRYGEGDPPNRQLAADLFASVEQFVDDATRRVGPALRTQDPQFEADVKATREQAGS